jgi:glycosyltransferase involved in cell wall biosynthesis
VGRGEQWIFNQWYVWFRSSRTALLLESAKAVGANVGPLDFWRREPDFDILHLWGMELQHSNTVKWAHAAGKKVVLSALTNYPSFYTWLRHTASLAVGPARFYKKMLAKIDCVTVVNRAQARYLVDILRVPAEKVTVVPNLVDDIFFETMDGSEEEDFEIKDYVLCTGNICPRKNQLALVGACRKLGVPLLLVGCVLTGEEEYGQAVAKAVVDGEGCRWVQGMIPGSAKLAGAYRCASVFALPSYSEQQPISALEAAASRKPLVLADRPYAKQEFYEHAVLSNPNSVDSIAKALRKAIDQPDKHCPPAFVVEKCRRQKIGEAYMEIYLRLVRDLS